MTTTGTNHRGLDLPTLRDILEDQQARKLDIVIPASQLASFTGQLLIAGQDDITEVKESGVDTYSPNGLYDMLPQFVDDLAEKLGIHVTFLRKLVEAGRWDLIDANLNGLLRGTQAHSMWESTEVPDIEAEADARNLFIRLFRSDVTRRGVARAALSDSFCPLDNLDGVMAVLEGPSDAGIDPSTLRITGDLSDKKMYLHVDAPEIAVLAPKFMEGYRSPFGDARIHGGRQTRGYSIEERRAIGQAYLDRGSAGAQQAAGVGAHNIFNVEDMPILFAGFDLSTSETGDGSYLLTPRITALECTNGYQFTAGEGAFRRTHIGSKRDVGTVQWSVDTQHKELALVSAQTRDLVQMVLSEEFVQAKVDYLEERSDVEVAEPEKKLEVLGKALKWTESQRAGIFDHFMRGGQYTAGGVAQAVTSYSQMIESVDVAADLNATAVRALELAAA